MADKRDDWNSRAAGVELLTSRVGVEDYTLDISTKRKVWGWATPSPDLVVSLINIRGAVLPLVDFAGRLELPVPDACDRSVTFVVEVA
ncbi:chemotaxis protein CheW [Roseobacter fucihabitans]|uniref:chemotaxis protein CheW n=1 Tax=Roseobacter fucihabitans TaxID=1537242 RepID=UPI003312F9AA